MGAFRKSPLFDERKAAEVAAFFLLRAKARQANVTLLKLMKLMYLSERESYRQFGEPMIGDALVSMRNGPVLSGTLDLINATPEERDDGQYWDKLIAERTGRDMGLRSDSGVASEDDLRGLSDSDIEILSDVWCRFGAMPAYRLSDYTHDPANCPEWEDPSGSSIPIKTETLLECLGFSSDEIKASISHLRERARIASQLAAASPKAV